MTCYFCGDETESYQETDMPLNLPYFRKAEWKRIPVCEKEKCQRKLKRRLKREEVIKVLLRM